MPAKAYLRILQGGVIASLFIIFFVFSDLLFPFITSKQLPFNILMEVLLVIWLVFLARFPKYRPKKNYIYYGLIAYFLVILISCLVSVDFNLSFWGDAERMLGFFHLIHFLILYFILITVFRSWREWQALFFVSVIIATVVSLLGIFGANVYSSIGNTAYVSGYLIFNIYFAVLLFFRGKNAWRWLYVLPVLVMLKEFWSCHTSGAIIGLALSILLLFLLLGLLHKTRSVRRWSLIIFILAVIGVAGIFSQYQADWFQNSFLRNLTAQKATFQTRLISWRGAAEDFHNHPLLGTGFGNYAIIFDKYFDPTFFNYVKNETYFDRAHNNLIDIASTTGGLGLVTYLGIFVAVFYYLFRELKKNGRHVGGDSAGMKNLEIVILIALIAAYFIQNLAVFDSFVTYVGLMLMLGFIYFLVQPAADEDEDEEEGNESKPLIRNYTEEYITLAILLIAAYLFASQYNLKPWMMFRQVISSYGEIMSGEFENGVESYKQAFALNTPLDRDGKTTLVNVATSNPNAFSTLEPSVAREDLDYIISLAGDNVAYNPNDSLMQMQLAQILDTAARYNYRDLNLYNYYSAQSVEAIDRSIEASPRRVPVYLTKAQILLGRGEKDEAIKTINYAISLNTDYYEGYCRLAQTYMLFKEEDKLVGILDKCFANGGLGQINSDRFLKLSVSYYITHKEYERALVIAEQLMQTSSQDQEVWLNLARIYTATGDFERAQASAKIALSLNPALSKQLTDILKAAPKATSSTKASSTIKK